MKKLIILPLVLLLILMAAVAVYADKPDKGSIDLEFDWPVFDCADYGDYDFEVWDHVVAHEWWTDHFDKAGNWVKTEYHIRGLDRIYNSNDPDHFAEGPYMNTCHVRPVPDEPGWVIGVWTGVWWNIQLPGEGTVYHESGLAEEKWQGDYDPSQVITLKRAGLEQRDFEALCRYLAE